MGCTSTVSGMRRASVIPGVVPAGGGGTARGSPGERPRSTSVRAGTTLRMRTPRTEPGEVPEKGSPLGGAPPPTCSVNTQDPPDALSTDERYMWLALDQARAARALDEVPVGAVVVMGEQVVGAAHNLTRSHNDPTAHAELLAVSQAARLLGQQRLVGATVYSTVEPCFMCAGALSHARVARLVFGVRDPKFGGCVSIGRVLHEERLNHRGVELLEGVLAEPARDLLVQFFQEKRRLARERSCAADEPDAADAADAGDEPL